jgi:cytochrome c-type biogenesis protein
VTLSAGSYGLGFLAGILSTLSPCVLPLLPLIVGGATGAHRLGPAALAAGLASSYVAIGLFLATLGFAMGLDGEVFRLIGALFLVALGAVLVVPSLQRALVAGLSPVGSHAHALAGRFEPVGLRGQFALGALLGLTWSPCVGPTLGAAATLAAQRQNLIEVAAIMLLFGLGAALPMVLIGLASRDLVARWRGETLAAGHLGKHLLGLALITIGGAILIGIDHRIETALVDWSPDWLLEITTRF